MARTGYKQTEEHKQKRGIYLSRIFSIAHRENLATTKRGFRLDECEVTYLYWKLNLPMSRIADLYNTHTDIIWKFMKRHNISRRTRWESKKLNCLPKRKVKPRDMELEKEKRLVGRPRILNWENFTAEEIRYLYWELGLPTYKVAHILGAPSNIISEKMVDWDIPKRSNREEHLGERNGFFRKHHTEERNRLISLDSERSRKIGIGNKGIPKPGKENAIKGAPKIAEYRRKEWLDPVKRETQLRAILKGLKIKPTKPEKELNILIDKACPDEYTYSGDGLFIIAGLCPDFTNINGKKKVIEMFGDYFHQGENPQDKTNRYAEFGFDCLVIWEHDLKEKSEEELVETIRKFNDS